MIIYHCNIAATENVHGPENKYFQSIHCVGATIAIITLYIPVIYICGNIFIRYIFEILVIEVNTLLNEILNLVNFFFQIISFSFKLLFARVQDWIHATFTLR